MIAYIPQATMQLGALSVEIFRFTGALDLNKYYGLHVDRHKSASTPASLKKASWGSLYFGDRCQTPFAVEPGS